MREAIADDGRVEFSVLGSGSVGNSTVVRAGESCVMVDAGLSARQLNDRAKSMGVETINAILLTHEHSDHVKGLSNFLKKHPVPVYATSHTSYVLRQSGIKAEWRTFEAGQCFSVCGLEVRSFSILHDAVDPVGYVLVQGETRLGILSDAGHVTNAVSTALKDLQTLFVEANYDDAMLAADTKRPWSIKQRISSRHGHLSNKQVADLLETIAHPRLLRIVLGHLSSDCNSERIAESVIGNALRSLSLDHVQVCCATQAEPRGWWSVSGEADVSPDGYHGSSR
jgi:phosphoribosyl 1,2-cyclic phosphodiesterase